MIEVSSAMNSETLRAPCWFNPAHHRTAQKLSPDGETVLRLANAGMHVFPCGSDKRPLGPWRKESTTDPEKVRAWWMRHSARWLASTWGSPG
jgi:hypothetical protein